MIEIKNLSKVFKSKNKEQTIAINDISFDLPDTGLVFIVGKSGSGKSTLLSLLGALDSITSGDIVVDGKSIKELSNNQYAYYRNSEVGFIFQDFHLLDNLTVFDNINLTLKLQRKEDKEKILDSLKLVDLEGYETRYPKELSGGQKQRVAIARTIIKEPRMILADEPTGNLDEKTSSQILDILKDISKKRLVVVVSHDILDARKYADRIIELSYGKIIKDSIRNDEFNTKVEIHEETLFIPKNTLISKEENELINNELKNSKIKHIKQVDDVFIDNTNSLTKEIKEKPFKKTHFKLKDNLKLGFKFLKSQSLMMCVYALIISALVCVMGLTQLIANFDDEAVISNELSKNNQNSLVLRKNKIKVNDVLVPSEKIVRSTIEDENAIKDTNFNGNIYPLYSLGLNINEDLLNYARIIPRFDPLQIYYGCTLGTLITNEKYLASMYGEDEKLEYAAILDDPKPYGVYISDYIADSFLYLIPTKYSKYEHLLGQRVDSYDNYRNAYINGIFKTNYKVRHHDAIQKLKKLDRFDSKSSSDKDIQKFIDEIYQFLALDYSFNPNYKEDFIKSHITYTHVRSKLSFKYEDSIYTNPNRLTIFNTNRAEGFKKLKAGECTINYNLANSILGSNYTSSNYKTFKPKEISLCIFDDNAIDEQKIIKEIPLTIKELTESSYMSLGDEDFETYLDAHMFKYGYYLDNVDNSSEIYDVVSELGYSPISSLVEPLKSITKIVGTFSNLFYLLYGILAICCVTILISYNLKSLKEKLYEIGVIKSLGGTNSDLFNIFSMQTFFISILVTIFFIVGSYLFIGFANDLLVLSIINLREGSAITTDITLLFVKPIYLLIDSLIILGISLLSFIIPVLKLRSIKPSNIIKKDE